MAIRKTEAIVLKTRDFRETSLIVDFFTRDFGKLTGLIKGIRTEPQRYGGLPLSFSRNSIVFYEKSKQELNLVTQCDAQEQFLNIRSDLQKINYANYFLELLDTVTQHCDKGEGLFELMIDSLDSLSQDIESWRVARIFEIKLLKLSGFKPQLDACVHCQKKITALAAFSTMLGGILCSHCSSFDRSAKRALRGSLASIEYIEKSSWREALKLQMARNIATELAAILANFIDVHLDKQIKSRKFLN